MAATTAGAKTTATTATTTGKTTGTTGGKSTATGGHGGKSGHGKMSGGAHAGGVAPGGHSIHVAEQHERAFQKQKGIFMNSKRLLAKKTSSKELRYWKDVGLGFQTPKEAKEGNYVDKKCPFTGDVAIRGRIIKGMVISTKMKRTVVVRRNYLHYYQKYNRFEKRHTNVSVHCSPCFDVKEGDIVTCGQCRPLSKTVRFNVLKAEKNQIFGSARKQFRLF
eukprot:GHVS01020397.1.p1 GENE.GHVS01020397.1~~GHVS01020397.1.p1  ORF type:complete len:220 (+),score=42.79 GHVS01020397.1:145-804(+)